MKAFEDLEFTKHPSAGIGGFKTASKLFFDNGYGVSVITGGYGSDQKPYELAVIFGTESDWDITYDTDLTDDVLGYLTNDEVTELMIKIQEL